MWRQATGQHFCAVTAVPVTGCCGCGDPRWGLPAAITLGVQLPGQVTGQHGKEGQSHRHQDSDTLPTLLSSRGRMSWDASGISHPGPVKTCPTGAGASGPQREGRLGTRGHTCRGWVPPARDMEWGWEGLCLQLQPPILQLVGWACPYHFFSFFFA